MSKSADLLRQESHFSFGDNWASYAKLVTEAQITDAVLGLKRLVGDNLRGKRFLDVGSGSGLHALAALRLGAAEVVSMDIDPASVATTRQLLQVHAPGMAWRVLECSVFDLNPASLGQFDIVYSWGVLHHTGDMYRAIRSAASLVAPGGQFVFALYRYTWMCWFWKIEKRWYARAGKRAQAWARWVYVTLFRIAKAGRFRSYVENYRTDRGMDFHHDIHDWLGGWPYESISPAQVDRLMQQLHMHQIHAFTYKGSLSVPLKYGCDEYVYVRH